MASFDLTAKDLADRTGLSHSYVRGLISGTYASKKGRKKVETALGMKIWSDMEPGITTDQMASDKPEAGQ